MRLPWTSSLLCFAATVTAQATQLTELPQCAVGCFQQAVVETTSCNPTDTACLCGGDNTVKIEKRASGCVTQNCENSGEVPALFKEICSGALASEQAAVGGEEAVEDGVVNGEAPAEEVPADQTPAEQASVEEVPVEQTPVEDVPVEEAPVEEALVEEAPVAEAPVEEAPVV